MITYQSIYKNGKPDYFFLKVDNLQDFQAFIRPYFIVTTIDKPRKYAIKNMECLFSCSVWSGKQSHGYGYSSSADVFNSLIEIIKTLHKKRLTPHDLQELNAINTHDDTITLSQELIDNLIKYNTEACGY